MHCIKCHAPDTRVIDSRSILEGEVTRRRRKCDICNHRFTTYEKLLVQLPAIVKHDGRRENYDKNKILKGIKKACHKRPISIEQIDQIIYQVEKNLLENFDKEVLSSTVGDLVMKKLYEVDPVAYVRFASFYWNFNNIDDFVANLQQNLKERFNERKNA